MDDFPFVPLIARYDLALLVLPHGFLKAERTLRFHVDALKRRRYLRRVWQDVQALGERLEAQRRRYDSLQKTLPFQLSPWDSKARVPGIAKPGS
jgi:hypothetical protein